MLHKTFRILIVKIGAIGDVVMSLPILPALRNKYPDAHITWLCGSLVAPLLRATTLVDRVIEIDEKKLLAGTLFKKIAALWQIWRRIGARRFDLILTLHPDPRYRLLARFSICADRRHWGQNGARFYPSPGRYHACEYLHLVNKEEGPLAAKIEFPKLHVSLKVPLADSSSPTIVLAPGGARNILADSALRRWPIQSYARLIEDLGKKGFRILVTGNESDSWVLPHLPKQHIHSFIGQLDLLDMIALLQQSALLITHDSGPLHLAKLARCPTIALFGPTSPHSFVSSQENIQVIWGGEHLCCRPCYNGKSYASCTNNLCLSSISPESVMKAAMGMLEGVYSDSFR